MDASGLHGKLGKAVEVSGWTEPSLNDGLPYKCNEAFTMGNDDGLIRADSLLLI